jgi:hypothetical protein
MEKLTKDLILDWMAINDACGSSFDYVNSKDTIEDLIELAPTGYISFFLRSNPQYAYLLTEATWSKMDGLDWSSLLRFQPQFSSKCDWSKLDGLDWRALLRVRPQFSSKCDWSKLDGYDWSSLLIKQPQLSTFREQFSINTEAIR